jgi:hypothetical protein
VKIIDAGNFAAYLGDRWNLSGKFYGNGDLEMIGVSDSGVSLILGAKLKIPL